MKFLLDVPPNIFMKQIYPFLSERQKQLVDNMVPGDTLNLQITNIEMIKVNGG